MCMSELRLKVQYMKTSGGFVLWKVKDIFSSPTEYSLKNASFRLHPVWGTHPDDPAVTIAEVLPLCPSRTNGNVGHKHRSQATQLGQNLSHIDAYNGKEKVHMEKHICEELDAQGMTRTSVREAPRYKWRTCLKMYASVVQGLTVRKLLRLRRKNEKREKRMKTKRGRRWTKSSA